MDNEIPQADVRGSNRDTPERSDTGNLHKFGRQDRQKGRGSRNHVNLLVSVPPYLSASKLVQSIKRRTSRKLLEEYKGLKRAFWGQPLWD